MVYQIGCNGWGHLGYDRKQIGWTINPREKTSIPTKDDKGGYGNLKKNPNFNRKEGGVQSSAWDPVINKIETKPKHITARYQDIVSLFCVDRTINNNSKSEVPRTRSTEFTLTSGRQSSQFPVIMGAGKYPKHRELKIK